MQRSLRLYLWDLQIASEDILTFTKGKTFADYSADRMLRAAVEREFMIIGEALRQMHDHYPNYMQKVYESRKIIDFRNVLIHKYASVDDVEVWSIVAGKLPQFHQQILALIEEHRAQFPDEYA